jgi:hypothetical protein
MSQISQIRVSNIRRGRSRKEPLETLVSLPTRKRPLDQNSSSKVGKDKKRQDPIQAQLVENNSVEESLQFTLGEPTQYSASDSSHTTQHAKDPLLGKLIKRPIGSQVFVGRIVSFNGYVHMI